MKGEVCIKKGIWCKIFAKSNMRGIKEKVSIPDRSGPRLTTMAPPVLLANRMLVDSVLLLTEDKLRGEGEKMIGGREREGG